MCERKRPVNPVFSLTIDCGTMPPRRACGAWPDDGISPRNRARTPADCDDQNECTNDSCDPDTGCVFEPKNCDDNEECTSDGCNPNTGASVHDDRFPGTPCSDDGNECTLDYCLSGNCVHPDVADGTACTSDGDPCTDDICVNGVCDNPPVDCDDEDECTSDFCDPDLCGSDCPCVHECIPHQPCSLEILTPDVYVCPGGTGVIEFRVTNSAPCGLIMTTTLSPDAGNLIDILAVNPSSLSRWYGPHQTLPDETLPPFTAEVTIDPASAFGTGTVKVSVENNLGPCSEVCDSGTVTVHVGKWVDLEIEGLSEDDEEDPGAFVGVNGDDDDENGTPDKDDAGPTTGEDDLVSLTVVADGSLTGTLTLSVAAGAGRIKVYESADRSNPVTLPQSWDLAGFPKTFTAVYYVEGVPASSTLRDVEFDLVLGGTSVVCQDDVKLTVIGGDLKEVGFSGGRCRKLYSDDGSLPYSAPHWQDNSSPPDGDADDAGDRFYPVAFVRTTPSLTSIMRSAAKIAVAPAEAFADSPRIRGVGPDGLVFEEVATLTGDELAITATDAAVPLGAAVRYYDPMEIEWSVSPDGGTLWFYVNVTEHPVYVVLEDPATAGLGPSERRHTLFRNSCRDADGATTEAGVLAGVWSDFVDLDVRRADDDQQLTYYASWDCTNLTTNALLASGDGQCGAWVKLLLDMLRAHGISYAHQERIALYYQDPSDPNLRFLVNDWSYAPTGGVSGDSVYPYLNIPRPGLGFPPILNNSYEWLYADVTDASGLPGQGPNNPPSLFQNHQVALAGRYYDPSYGQSHASLGPN